ncbi:MAG: LptE family protein [Paludibacteraceae bacterium]
MKFLSKIYFFLVLAAVSFGLSSCTVSYKFNGASIDYTKVKSISIADFPNNAEFVNPTLSQTFTEALRDKYTRQTRLRILKQGGDMQLEGEIVGYQLASMAISADSYASETRLTLTINVRFANTKNPDESIEDQKYTAYQMFDSSKMLNDVQDELVKIMVDEIVDKIYNDTVAKW